MIAQMFSYDSTNAVGLYMITKSRLGRNLEYGWFALKVRSAYTMNMITANIFVRDLITRGGSLMLPGGDAVVRGNVEAQEAMVLYSVTGARSTSFPFTGEGIENAIRHAAYLNMVAMR